MPALRLRLTGGSINATTNEAGALSLGLLRRLPVVGMSDDGLTSASINDLDVWSAPGRASGSFSGASARSRSDLLAQADVLPPVREPNVRRVAMPSAASWTRRIGTVMTTMMKSASSEAAERPARVAGSILNPSWRSN